MFALDDRPDFVDLLSMPVIPAFFIGLTSLVATARLTRSTDATTEAIGTAYWVSPILTNTAWVTASV